MIGAPKSIHNDVWMTEHTLDLETAMDIAAEAIDGPHTAVESHNRVIFVEVMGATRGPHRNMGR